MADAFYAEMQGVATEILTEYEQGEIKLISVQITPGDEAWNTGDQIRTEYTLRAVAKPVDKRWVTGTTVIATDIEVVAAVQSFSGGDIDPHMEDRVVVDGIERGIKKLIRIPEAGICVAWRMIIEGA